MKSMQSPPIGSTTDGRTSSAPFDPGPAMQWFLILDGGLRLLLWSAALGVTMWIAARWGLWTPVSGDDLAGFGVAWQVSQRVAWLLVIYNVVYLLLLVLLRLPIPRPASGRYELTGGTPPRALLWTCLLAIVTKARYQAPFPAFLVPNLAQIAPLRWLLGATVGPRTGSIFVGDPLIIDPHNVTIGRNVTIGFQTTVAAHLQERSSVTLTPTVIEDDVLIGGYTAVAGGVIVKRGAVVGAHSFVKPGTVVGENEFWGGCPAKKIADLPPLGSRAV